MNKNSRFEQRIESVRGLPQGQFNKYRQMFDPTNSDAQQDEATLDGEMQTIAQPETRGMHLNKSINFNYHWH